MTAILVSTPLMANSHGAIGDRYYGHMYGGGMGFFGIGMMVLVWGSIILLSVLAIRFFTGQNKGQNAKTDALDILRERLAKGDIEPEEFDIRRKTLES